MQDLIVEIYMRDRSLNESIPPALRKPMECLIRMVNSYYSNRIEGNLIMPSEVLHLQEEFDTHRVRDELLEVKQHLEVQFQLAKGKTGRGRICSPDFFRLVHEAFYEGLPRCALC